MPEDRWKVDTNPSDDLIAIKSCIYKVSDNRHSSEIFECRVLSKFSKVRGEISQLIMFPRLMREMRFQTTVLMCHGYTGHRLEVLHVSWAKVTQGLAIVLVAIQLRRCIAASERCTRGHGYLLLVPVSPDLLCPFEPCSSRIYSSSANLTELPGLPIRRIFTSSITRGELISQQSSLSSRVLPQKDAKGFEDGSRWEQDGGRDCTEKRRKGQGSALYNSAL